MNDNNRKDFIRASLGLATAQICHGLGWHSMHRSSHDILTDLLERYISQVSKTAVNISQTCCRTIPNLEDVALTFDHLGIHLQELQDYVQQVEASPAPKPLGPIPVKTEQNLMDFSGEDHLPAPIKIMPKVETEPVATEIKEEPMEEDMVDGVAANEERPKNLSLGTDGLESPPYSPLEPKSLNLGALANLDLTRPDLKVATPKGYTPIITSPSSVVVATTAVSVTTIVKTTTTTTTPPADQISFTSPKSEPIANKTVKKEKKEKKESSKKPTPDKKETPQKSLLSPPMSATIGVDKISSPGSAASSGGSGGKTKKIKTSSSPSPVLQKKEKQPEAVASKNSMPSTPSPGPSPYLLGSPDLSSSLFSPPRKKLAMYQSDKKKPSSKEKSSKESKDNKTDKSSPSFGASSSSGKEKKEKSSSKTKSSHINSPLSSSIFSSPHKIFSPPSVKRELSPPHLSSPLIKKESSGAPKRTVIFPPSNNSPSSSDVNQSPQLRLSKQNNEEVVVKKEKFETVENNSPRVIDETDKINDGTPPFLKITPISGKVPKEEPSETPVTKQKKKDGGMDSSEQEIDVMSLSQDESSYTETFKPNMFFPTFGEEKKKKKKKNKDKQREEKGKKNDGMKDKKEKKKKREEAFASPSPLSTSSAIPRLTLKMGTETISDAPTKFSSVPRGPCSPMNKFSTAMSAAALPPPPPLKKKKNKHKQKSRDKEREKEREKEKDQDYKSGFYVETITNTTSAAASDVYYCPGCGKPDDGSPMIGCDSCDDWYHWPCVNIEEEPEEDEKWFCPNCPNGVPIVKKKKKKKKRDDL